MDFVCKRMETSKSAGEGTLIGLVKSLFGKSEKVTGPFDFDRIPERVKSYLNTIYNLNVAWIDMKGNPGAHYHEMKRDVGEDWSYQEIASRGVIKTREEVAGLWVLNTTHLMTVHVGDRVQELYYTRGSEFNKNNTKFDRFGFVSKFSFYEFRKPSYFNGDFTQVGGEGLCPVGDDTWFIPRKIRKYARQLEALPEMARSNPSSAIPFPARPCPF